MKLSEDPNKIFVKEAAGFDEILKEAVVSSVDSLEAFMNNEAVFNAVLGNTKDENGNMTPKSSVSTYVRIKSFLAGFSAILLGNIKDPEERREVCDHLGDLQELSESVVANTFLMTGLLKKEELKSIFPSITDADLNLLVTPEEAASMADSVDTTENGTLREASERLGEYLRRYKMPQGSMPN